MQSIYTLLWYKIFGLDFLPFAVPKPQVANKLQKQKLLKKPINANIESKEVIKNYAIKTQGINNNDSFEELQQDILHLNCQIKNTARNTVIIDGKLTSKIMLIGEAPGQEEDIQGKPFVGQSGLLLNNMLLAVGIKRSNTLISNIVFWRPPGNRNPSQEEITLCLPYVYRLIKIVKPKVIMLLGSIAVHSLLDPMLPISKQRGKISSILGIKTISTYHPAYLLRAPYNKELAFRDFILLKETYDK